MLYFFLFSFEASTPTPRPLYCHRWLSTSATPVPSTGRKYYSTDNVKNEKEDKVNQEPEHPNTSDKWSESEPGDDRKAEEEEEEYEHGIKQRVLNASLNHVLTLGWSKDALQAGARDEGLSDAAHGIFQKGGVEIVNHFYKKCNADLVEYMKQEVERQKAEGQEKPKIRPFIQNAVETRLKMIIPYQSIWKEAMAIQALPQNAPDSWKNLMNVCDDIWYFAGDRSTDFNWYTKRSSLAACYKATEIYMLQDSSPDYQDSWIFLDNRLNNLETLGKATRALEPFEGLIKGLFEMGRNAFGMNSRKR